LAGSILYIYFSYIVVTKRHLEAWRYPRRHLLDPWGKGWYMGDILEINIEIFCGIVKDIFAYISLSRDYFTPFESYFANLQKKLSKALQ
jgi:multisubunit Na+/H+ antiporter MnhB subunit